MRSAVKYGGKEKKRVGRGRDWVGEISSSDLIDINTLKVGQLEIERSNYIFFCY